MRSEDFLVLAFALLLVAHSLSSMSASLRDKDAPAPPTRWEVVCRERKMAERRERLARKAIRVRLRRQRSRRRGRDI